MRIVSSVFPKEIIQEDIKCEFPEIQFEFYKRMKDAEKAFYECEVFLTYGDDLTDNHIQKNDHLKWIMQMSTGLKKYTRKSDRRKRHHDYECSLAKIEIQRTEYTLGTILQWVK